MTDQTDTICRQCRNSPGECTCSDGARQDSAGESNRFERDPEEGQPSGTTSDTDEHFETQRLQVNFDVDTESVVDAKFRIIGELGSGADSIVYLAEHLYLQKRVSLKLFKPIDFESNRFARIQREAVTLANIDHPNIVGVTDLGIMQNGTPYIVQEYIEGRDFQSLIKEKGPLPYARALKLFCEIASGIAFLHDRGIIHRDIKPSNIIISPSVVGGETAKLIDLGIAKPDNPGGALSFCTTSGSIFGSPFYMSPEQCKGENIDSKTDIYSFGCVMYEALTGYPPFRGQTMLVTLEKHISEQAMPIGQRRGSCDAVPKDLEKLIRRCLSKNPEDRYDDARSLFTALQVLERKSHRSLHKPAVVMAICIVLLLGLLAVFVAKSQQPALDMTSAYKKVDSFRLVDKLSYAGILGWIGPDSRMEQVYREIYEEARRQNVPPLTLLQAGQDLGNYYYIYQKHSAQNALFHELKPAIKEVDKKFNADPQSFQGKSLDCVHRIYYFAAVSALHDKNEGVYAARERLLNALKYAQFCEKERDFATAAPALIKSRLGEVYCKTALGERGSNRTKLLDEAEKILKEANKEVVTTPMSGNRTLVANFIAMARIELARGNYDEASARLNDAVGINSKGHIKHYTADIDNVAAEIKAAFQGQSE